MSTEDYDEILEQVQLLTLDDQLRLLEDIASMLRQQFTTRPQHSIMELEGLGKEIWEGIDVEKYIKDERNSWDR